MFFSRPAGDKFIQRVNPTVEDFTTTDFTWDGVLHTLDLSTIVPVNAKRVVLSNYIKSDSEDNYLGFCPVNSDEGWDMIKTRAQVANVNHNQEHSVVLSTPQTIKYIAKIYVGTITGLEVTIIGWWV